MEVMKALVADLPVGMTFGKGEKCKDGKEEMAKEAQMEAIKEDDKGERGSKAKGKAFSFSPLSWLAKVTGKEKPCALAKHAPASSTWKSSAGTAGAPPFPSCLPKRTTPSPAMVTHGRPCSPPRRSPPDVAPRRLSVGNDSADAVAVRRYRRRHCSLGGDSELPPLGRLIPFSLAGSPARAAASTSAAAPSDATDAARARSSSFSGRMPPPRVRVRVRSPRRAPGGLAESLAVVRRTRDPQRAFRESMVEMIASTRGGAGELERLLACYLSLNADEHHDCIVKVFRQVWFEYVSLLPRPDAAGGGRRRPLARRRS
nr:transcription repressor OFP1-like [Setaria viridis]